MVANTWELRLEAGERLNETLAGIKAAQRLLDEARAMHADAIRAHENAVAANISESRGYPCDHFGHRLD